MTTRPKPLVEYDLRFPVEISLGIGAIVKPVNHPDTKHVSNTKLIMTSPVIKYDGAGCFETENTLYVPRHAVN